MEGDNLHWTNVPITVSKDLNATLPWRWWHVIYSVWVRCCVSRNKRLLNVNADLTRKPPEKRRLVCQLRLKAEL